ncbi:MAG: hypothetical protein MK135_17485, partial [Polyangiaceae bacterium]|nr:hypothetical protein [Polyangiaceae bacterium]
MRQKREWMRESCMLVLGFAVAVGGSSACGGFRSCQDNLTCTPSESELDRQEQSEASALAEAAANPSGGGAAGAPSGLGIPEDEEQESLGATDSTTERELPADYCVVGDPRCSGVVPIYLSPEGQAGASGSEVDPVGSLERALELAAQTSGVIFACDGDYDVELGSLNIPPGTIIRGGYSCGQWQASLGRTRFLAETSRGHAIRDAKDIVLSALEFVAPTAQEPGQSSIGLRVVNSQNLRLDHVAIEAGRGADGAEVSGYIRRAESGTPGEHGTVACGRNLGASGVVTICEGQQLGPVSARGGHGGSEFFPSGEAGADAAETASSRGRGGRGVDAAKMTTCSNGGRGVDGDDGVSGEGASDWGSLTADGEYAVAPGTPGFEGEIGHSGGGGGGGPYYQASVCSRADGTLSSSGGSGGAGGCPGKGGQAGKSGGASLGLVLLNSSASLTNLQVRVAQGGAGTPGVAGQSGGYGGTGGMNASFGVEPYHRACAGGPGGEGGHGGTGGPGAGGPSVALVAQGSSVVQEAVLSRLP